jgi:hypothetical protein
MSAKLSRYQKAMRLKMYYLFPLCVVCYYYVMPSYADSNPGQQAVIFTALAACEKTNKQTTNKQANKHMRP